jgi:DNA polymerase-3 subunit epsilon
MQNASAQSKRQIVLDTETTGINPKDGHRIIEIGCVELIDRKLSGNNYHVYINPMREIEQEAINVHGITNEQLADKPLFKDIVHDFIAFIKGAELIIHNAPFDVGFMDHEFELTDKTIPKTDSLCAVVDTLVMARRMRPGQKNSLDALCKFYNVDTSRRVYHGALLDSEILAEVYLYMTGGQTSLSLNAGSEDNKTDGIETLRKLSKKPALKIIHATADDIARDEAIFG